PADTRRVLASRGLRCTMQRELIFQALMQAHTHPTADELFRIVRPRHPGLSLATVYNTLEALTAAGLARRLAPGPGEPHASFRYDADTSDHVHLVTPDGLVRDVPEAVSHAVAQRLTPDLIRELEAAIGAPIARIRVELIQADIRAADAAPADDLCDPAP
ncbi:MAG: transcriptional repressor, partial [Phycisphaerales bacterium]|nr:transcriptional repressor [Phycisphaerales bacterium]